MRISISHVESTTSIASNRHSVPVMPRTSKIAGMSGDKKRQTIKLQRHNLMRNRSLKSLGNEYAGASEKVSYTPQLLFQ